jgi:hypothetical protein
LRLLTSTQLPLPLLLLVVILTLSLSKGKDPAFGLGPHQNRLVTTTGPNNRPHITTLTP